MEKGGTAAIGWRIDFVSSSLLDDEDRRRYMVVSHSFGFAETAFGFFLNKELESVGLAG